MGGTSACCRREIEPAGETGTLDVAHLQSSHVAGTCCVPGSSGSSGGRRDGILVPFKLTVCFGGDRVAVEEINNFSWSKMRLGNDW